MEPGKNIKQTLNNEKVTSTYAEIYFHDEHDFSHNPSTASSEAEKNIDNVQQDKEWISPSDLLIDVVKLHLPLTSKITRGKTHEGILAIGNEVLNEERETFLKSLTKLLQDNNDSWDYILMHEKEEIIRKVKVIYQNIFNFKSDIMKTEIALFYENTLQDLEKHLKTEVNNSIQSVYASIISDSNIQIQQKLLEQKNKLENILQITYTKEIEKIKTYYSLLLHNEFYRNNKLINKAILDKNHALKSFYKQIEAERITSTMYIMSLERKKCRIQNMLLENLHSYEIKDKIQNIQDKSDIIQDFKQKYTGTSLVNKQWQQKIMKILQIFLKFINFSLKLLPEQSSFLLSLEEMVILQLKDLEKNPQKMTNILINEDLEANIFQFEEPQHDSPICDKEPFILVGDLSDPLPKQYGSQDTIPPDVDLPYVRIGRQFTYAKCHGYEDIKKLLDSQICKCNEPPPEDLQIVNDIDGTSEPAPTIVQCKSESSLESLFSDRIELSQDCPMLKCNNWINRYSFPDLTSYLDYSEDNFRRVTAILQPEHPKDPSPVAIDPKSIAYSELPFSETKEPVHNVGTQFSSQEDLTEEMVCSCIKENIEDFKSHSKLEPTCEQFIEEIFAKRKRSLEQLIHSNPTILKIIGEEYYDYKM